MSKTIETEKQLNAALERLLNGNPINTKKGRKLSYSAIEDEAKVSRSLIRSYPSVFERAQDLILIEKVKKGKAKIGNVSGRQVNEKKNLREANQKLKELNLFLKEKNEILLKANIGMAERIQYLEKQVNID
jgi:hypothetical protein